MFTEPGTYEVRLVVEDDNGATSETQFSLSIEDSSASDLKQPSVALVAASILGSLALGGSLVFVLTRKTAPDTSLPKWEKKSLD
jgi:PKD repeat protein